MTRRPRAAGFTGSITLVGVRRLPRGSAGRLEATLARIAGRLGLRERGVAVLFTDDEGIRAYNARHRRRDEPTDVLAFPSDVPGHAGDLVVSVRRAAEQGRAQGHSTTDEIEVLLLHGTLHLIGHDHETDAGAMRRLESRLALELFGSRRGLVERACLDRDRPSRRRPPRG